jgi:crotonobetainyl-CoA:carnitine CoA-transferase CaiB-like acyl-CoA transferase
MDRREFMQTTGYAALGVAAASTLSSNSQAASNDSDFDIDKQFERFMHDIGGSVEDAGGSVTFSGKDPMIQSRVRIGACMALPAMAAGVGAATIWKHRTGEEQDLKVDLRESLYNVNPLIGLVQRMDQAAGNIPADNPVPNSFGFIPTVNGMGYQAPLMIGHPLSFATFQTKDGKWATPTGAYPHLYHGFLNVVGASPNTESMAAEVKKWDAEDLDEAVADAGFVLGIHRTAEEWAEHPEGEYLAKTPVIEIVKVGDADPIPFTANPSQPLSGVKALSLTHVIAGTCAARTLAEYGAEVLHIARDQAVEHDFFVQDINVGMRSAFLNLRREQGKDALNALIPETNVFIEGFRGRSIDRLGFGVEEVVKKRPGIVYLSLRCYGWDGPWKNRAGFDMEGLTVSGITMAESEDGVHPQFPPTRVLNDYIAGYLGASGILAALNRQAQEGGSYHVRVNLTRAAMWYRGIGLLANKDIDLTNPEHQMIDPEVLTKDTPYGEIRRLGPQVKLSRTPGRWRDPLVSVRGSDLPVWTNS